MRPAFVITLFVVMALWLVSCAPQDQTPEQSVQVSHGPNGVAQLAWNPGDPNDPSVIAYFIHYGTASPGVPGSCDYETSQYVPDAQTEATLIGLLPNTRYYVAVSAYNGLESLCSEEISFIDQ